MHLSLLLAVLLVPQPSEPAQESYSRAMLQELPTQQAARLFLPEDVVGTITHFTLAGRDRFLPGNALRSVTFFTAPRRVSDGVCRRVALIATLQPVDPVRDSSHPDPPVQLASVVEFPEVVLAEGCGPSPHRVYARVQPAYVAEEAVAALQWLAEAQRRAASGARLPFRLRCRSRDGHDRCASGARNALAQLPLHSTYIIDAARGDRSRWDFAVAPEGLGRPLWNVSVALDAETPEVSMEWRRPHPF